MNAAELTAELLRLSKRMDEANTAVRDRGRTLAEAERDYRKHRAECWLTAEGTAQERKDLVDSMSADLRYARDLADHDRQAALEAVRNCRTQISALQSIANVEREEMSFSRTEPGVPP